MHGFLDRGGRPGQDPRNATAALVARQVRWGSAALVAWQPRQLGSAAVSAAATALQRRRLGSAGDLAARGFVRDTNKG